MADKKKSRAGFKSALTRSVNNIACYLAEEDEAELRKELNLIKKRFENFKSAHDEYHAILTEEDEIESSDDYYCDMQSKYVSAIKSAKAWLKSCEVSQGGSKISPSESCASSSFKEGTRIQNELIQHMNLPKVELPSFDGNPLNYHNFMTLFDENVHSVCNDDKVKLTRLLQYTCKEANRAIQSCVVMGGSDGYKKARQILQERFGDNHLISQKVITTLKGNPPIRSSDQLARFSDDLQNWQTTLSSLGMTKEVDTQSFIIDLVSKLQPYIRTKWRKKAMELKGESKRYPTFGEFVAFVVREATIATDPVYGEKCQHQTHHTTRDSRSSFFTSKSGGNDRCYRCILCKENHRLLYCPKFKEMKVHDRVQFVAQHKLCENCLMNNHSTATCRKVSVCSVPGCGKRHTRYIHVNNKEGHGGSRNCDQSVKLVNANVNASSGVYMPVVAVRVNGSREVCALLDTASSNTFCSKALTDALRLNGVTVNYSLSTLSNDENVESNAVDLNLSSLDGQETLKMRNVYVVDRIPVKTTCPNFEQYSRFKGLQFVASGQDIDLLIGQDNAEALCPFEVIRGNKGEPFACKTLFGWSMNGPERVQGPVSKKVISHFIKSSPVDDVEKLWSLENEGVNQGEVAYSREDQKVLDLWDRETVFVDGHYQVPIPWKEHVEVPNNYVVAKSRLISLRKSLEKDDRFGVYDEEIRKLIVNGHAESVSHNEFPEKVWYLPHHGVVSDKKPGKLRVVFDCASRFQGQSLNEKCYRGPDLNNKLLNILLRFRQHQFCVMADVECMYYQVRIPPEERDALRFLWFTSDGDIAHYRMTGHIFGGVWCAASSTYALRKVLSDDANIDPLVADTIRRDFYVDDCLKSLETLEEAHRVIVGTRELLGSRGFRLTKFVVNDPRLLGFVPEDDRAKEVKQFTVESTSKALGVQWKVQSDELYFTVNVDLGAEFTRRAMLSFLASIYDPLGLASPVVVLGKILFQESTRRKLSWDESLPPDLHREWIDWLRSLRGLRDLRISRCIKPSSFNDAVAELHHFCDSSERAYGACSYIRLVNKTGQVHTALVISRCKVAPLKSCTIPRLELQAAVLAVRLDELLRAQLDLDLLSSTFWSDSEIVLKYVKNEKRRFHVFVSNRLSVIWQLSDSNQWHHVSGLSNPADMITRSQCIESFDLKRWLQGPEFLRLHKCDWVVRDVDVGLADDDPEVKRDVIANIVEIHEVSPTDRMLVYFSEWIKIKRAVGWFLRFVDFLKSGGKTVKADRLSSCDFERAEVAIIGYVQRKHFSSEVAALTHGQSVPKSSSIRALTPVLDERGLLRVKGRLTNALVPVDHRMPLIIPHSHVIAKLIVWDVHSQSHLGTEWIVSLVRRKYWITKTRVVVKSVARECFKCKRLFASPETQLMADLPRDRLRPDEPPFVSIGVDCFGPFYVKQGRSQVKRYGCIFTCMASRAIHLEVLSCLSADSFICGLRRFCGRRGQPHRILCDNGSNFVGAKSELERDLKTLDFSKIERFCAVKDIEWKFNPPCAPHAGGVWERLIGVVKRVLSGLLDLNMSSSMNDEMLCTLFVEIECVVNGRPLTKVSEDVNDFEALTPNHLLMLRNYVSLPPGKLSQSDLFRKRWRAVQHVAELFWSRWTREYIPELQRRCKWLELQRNLKIGDLVLLCEENTPRNVWPLGLITNVFPSSDGLVRSVQVKTKCTTLVRPVCKLVLLECSD